MSELLLVTGSVVVIAALVGVLAVYLYVISGVVRHIAETLEEKVKPGAAGVAEHVAEMGPAASGVRRRLGRLGTLSTNNRPTPR